MLAAEEVRCVINLELLLVQESLMVRFPKMPNLLPWQAPSMVVVLPDVDPVTEKTSEPTETQAEPTFTPVHDSLAASKVR